MIELRHLVKRYGALLAVNDLSLQLHAGEILGFLGPNGAGKSTTMKMLTGFIQPDSGQVLIHGIDMQRDPIAAQRLIGYLPEGAPSYEGMLVEQFLLFIAEIRGFKGQQKGQVVTSAVAKMALESVLEQKIETLSKGFKRRVGLAQAILHDPKVLILDEPTDGLDPNQKHQVRDLIRGLSKDKIVIISTHILEEVTAVCTRTVILANGSLIEDCSPADLEQRSVFHSAVTVVLKEPLTDVLMAEMEGLPGVDHIEYSVGSITVFPDSGIKLFEAIKAYCESRTIPISDIYQEKGRLDDVFRQLTVGGVR